MSYSTSPPQKAAPRPYSPYQDAGSPTNPGPYGPPPAKRQRMSPDPRSPPNNVPAYSQPHGLPSAGGYGNPYAQQQGGQSPYTAPAYTPSPTYAHSPQGSFNTPQPYAYQHMPYQSSQPPTPVQQAYSAHGQSTPPQQQSRGMMPPPPRPNKEEREEKVGVEEIGDSLFGSGINLKDEENYMHSMYNNRHTQGDSFSTNQNPSSFGSSTMSPTNSFNLLTQGTSFGSQDAAHAALAGTMGPTMSQEDIEVEHRRKRAEAARAQAERRQHHLENQFLLGNNVRTRCHDIGREQGVTINMTGVFVKNKDTSTTVNGTGQNGMVEVKDRPPGVQQPEPKAASLVNQGALFEQMLSLVSLAAGERIRALLDEAHALARARRYGDHGRVVPPEFADIADGEGKQMDESVLPESITGTQWDKAPESADVQMADGEKDRSSTPRPQHTISFQGSLNAHLRSLAERDKQAEKDRIKKREARRRAAEAAANGDTVPSDTAAPEAATTNGLPTDANLGGAPKMSKKEQERVKKANNKSTDAQTHTSTNQTAAMMALGKKGSKFSWMTGGAASLPTNRYAPKATPSGTATPSKAGGDGGSGPTTPGAVGMVKTGSSMGAEPKVPQWGDWRELGSGGDGLQIRDWVMVLERDGREKGALQKALNRMS